MKPEEIVNNLLEDEEDDEAEVKSFILTNLADIAREYKLVHGDVDAWEYGGVYANFDQAWVIPGRESEDLNDVEPSSIELSEEENAQIMSEFPVIRDEDGFDENEEERLEAVDALKEKKAEEKTAQQKQRVYRFLVEPFDDEPEDGLLDHVGGREVWDGLDDVFKWFAYGEYHGFHELDPHPYAYTKAELEKILGVKL